LAHALEIGTAVDIQVEDHHVDGTTLAGAGQRRPVLARNKPVPVATGRTQPCEPGLMCEERRDYTHATIRSGERELDTGIATMTP
jgi:hypothetical protein